MTSKKQPVKEEPFLNTVARKLGYAAGTFTNVAQELTENLSTLPKAVSTKVQSTAGTVAGLRSRRKHSKKKTRQAARPQRTKVSVTARKRKPATKKPSVRVKAVSRKKKE